jgi:SAM-dependent methyltransferase
VGRRYHPGMAETEAAPPRYDALADGYARHWGPVIRPAAIALLDRVEAVPRDSRLLDLGTGTGTLAVDALGRWPAIDVVGVDPSPAMLELAVATIERAHPPGTATRFTPVTAFADALPFPDNTFDAGVSSFVLQLVPSRARALAEVRRVLRPGAHLAWVTWLAGGSPFRGDEVVDRVLDEFGFDPPERDVRSGDPASVPAAAAATRRAGFRDVRAEGATLTHSWTPEGYRDFIAEFDEQSTFEELAPDERARAERRLLDELGRLTTDELTLRLPIVYVTGTAR